MNDSNIGWLPAHYERELGKIDRGWSDRKRDHAVQVVSFRNQPEARVKTFATLGLSRHLLAQPRSPQIRQELLISAHEKHSETAVAALLLSIAEHILSDHRALLRGDVTAPDLGEAKDWSLAALYVANPSPFDRLAAQQATQDPPIVFAYLIPVTAAETLTIRKRGWRWFDEQLELQNPDIWDLSRVQEIVEP